MRLTVRLLAIAAAVFFSSCEEKEAVQPGAGITSFSFLKENNPSLTEDVSAIRTSALPADTAAVHARKWR